MHIRFKFSNIWLLCSIVFSVCTIESDYLELRSCALLLVDNGNVVLSSYLTYQQIYRVTLHDGCHQKSMNCSPNRKALSYFVEFALSYLQFSVQFSYWTIINCLKNSQYHGTELETIKWIPEFLSLRHAKVGTVCNISI